MAGFFDQRVGIASHAYLQAFVDLRNHDCGVAHIVRQLLFAAMFDSDQTLMPGMFIADRILRAMPPMATVFGCRRFANCGFAATNLIAPAGS